MAVLKLWSRNRKTKEPVFLVYKGQNYVTHPMERTNVPFRFLESSFQLDSLSSVVA